MTDFSIISTTMDDHGDFDSVSWQRDVEDGHRNPSGGQFPDPRDIPHRSANGRRSSSISSEPQAGEDADAVDLAGIGDGVLDCTVDTPLKENDGTKDAYVSYLISTHVCDFAGMYEQWLTLTRLISNPFRKPAFPFVGDLQTSFSFEAPYTENIQHALYHLCLRRTTWHT